MQGRLILSTRRMSYHCTVSLSFSLSHECCISKCFLQPLKTIYLMIKFSSTHKPPFGKPRFSYVLFSMSISLHKAYLYYFNSKFFSEHLLFSTGVVLCFVFGLKGLLVKSSVTCYRVSSMPVYIP